MKHSRTLLAFFWLMCCTLPSCQTLSSVVHKEPEIRWDTPRAVYPKYRIDHLIRKMCVIGTGEGRHDISSFLTKFFLDKTNIKIVEPGNLEAILKGRILEYGSSLTPDEAQLLSQMFQVDHVLLFHEKISPHQDYMLGGRAYVRINLKIYNTRSGEIVFQSSHEFGRYVPDPRPRYSHYIEEPGMIHVLRQACLGYPLGFELRHAFGDCMMGIGFDTDDCVIGPVIIDSPAYRAGLKKGDRILEIDGLEVRTTQEFLTAAKNRQKQGRSVSVKIERDGKILELELKFPVIPKAPTVEIHEEKITKQKPPASAI